MKLYLEMNALLAIAFILFRTLYSLIGSERMSAQFWLKMGRVTLITSLTVSLGTSIIPKNEFFTPLIRLNKNELNTNFTLQLPSIKEVQSLNNELNPSSHFDYKKNAIAFIALIAVLIVLILAFRFFLNFYRLRRSLNGFPVIRKIGRVKISVSPLATIPYSAWCGGQAYVVLPENYLLDPNRLKLSVAHELQHHRQRDTVLVYGMELIKSIFFANPAVYAWNRMNDQLQEFACDEYLIRTRGFSSHAYGSCLIEAAKQTLTPFDQMVGTTSMAAGNAGQLLKRRIEMLFTYKPVPISKSLRLSVILGTLTLIAGSAYAAHGLIQSRGLSRDEAETYAQKSERSSEFPIDMNDLVFKELNRILQNENSRDSMKVALSRMKIYESMIRTKIEGFELPEELLAVPIVESGYRNYNSPNSSGAGLWGFIVSTGRKYGLNITAPNTPGADERLVENRETLAAMRYFTSLHQELKKDWRLALLGYNIGENQVLRLIKKYRTRDPWELERNERSPDNYLAKMTAAIIILKNPSLLD